MIEVKVDNEYSALISVILGVAEDMGDPPKVFDRNQISTIISSIRNLIL